MSPAEAAFTTRGLDNMQVFNFKGFCGTGGSITSARDSPGFLFTVAAMSPAVEEQVEALQYVLPVCRSMVS